MVKLTEYPTIADWMEVKRRALITVGKRPVRPPDETWEVAILTAAHSPIRYLRFSFDLLGIPSYAATHLARHVHAQPYIRTQRTDRTGVDRHELPQDEPVDMIYDVNAEELLTIARKRLCNQADPTTRAVVREMCCQVEEQCPEFRGLLQPLCEWLGRCPEMKPCGKH